MEVESAKNADSAYILQIPLKVCGLCLQFQVSQQLIFTTTYFIIGLWIQSLFRFPQVLLWVPRIRMFLEQF